MIMRKKIKLPLEMADGVKVRTLDELKDNWSLEKVVENYLNGRLATWLNDRYYTELAEQVDALDEVQDNTALQKELCRIFDVDFADEEDIDVDAVNERNRKLDILRQHTADDTVLKNVDIVAFDQEELGDILDSGENVIYLFNNTFSIPLSVKNKKYIGIGKAECLIHSKDVVDFTNLHRVKKPYRINIVKEEHVMVTHKKATSILKKWGLENETISDIYYEGSDNRNENAFYIGKDYVLKFSANLGKLKNHITISKALENAGLFAATPVLQACFKAGN